MGNTRIRRRTARPLVVSSDIQLNGEIASWEVELVFAELTAITDRVCCGGERSLEARRHRYVAG